MASGYLSSLCLGYSSLAFLVAGTFAWLIVMTGLYQHSHVQAAYTPVLQLGTTYIVVIVEQLDVSSSQMAVKLLNIELKLQTDAIHMAAGRV